MPYKLNQVKLVPLDVSRRCDYNTGLYCRGNYGSEECKQRRCEKAEEPKIITIPSGWKIKTDTRIFANYHLFGIPYLLCPPEVMLEHLNSGLIQVV